MDSDQSTISVVPERDKFSSWWPTATQCESTSGDPAPLITDHYVRPMGVTPAPAGRPQLMDADQSRIAAAPERDALCH